MRRARRVIAVRHEQEVAVPYRDGQIELVRRAVETLQGERAWRLVACAEVVRLLEHCLAFPAILVVLVRRIARPVARRCVHLDHENAFGREVGLDDVVDLSRRVSGAAHLDLDVVGRDHHRLAPVLAARPADRDVALQFCREGGVAREIERRRQPGEDVFAPPDLPALPGRLDAAGAAQRDEHRLDVVGCTRERPVMDLEAEVPPSGGLGRDAPPSPRLQKQLAHTGAPWTSARVGIASEHATRPATIAPAVLPSRTPSSSPSPRTSA